MNKINADGFITAVENHCSALHPIEPEDYKVNGMMYCGKCYTPRNCVIKIH